MLPEVILELVGKTFGFGITADEHNIAYGVEIFKAMKFWNLQDIVTTDSTVDSVNLSEKDNMVLSCSEVNMVHINTIKINGI